MSTASASLVGHIGEVGSLTSVGQTQYLGFRLAVNRREKAAGQWEDRTTWWSVRIWGDKATSLAQRLAKGDRIFVTGVPFLEEWTGRDGVKRSTLRITADRIEILVRAADRPARPAAEATAHGAQSATAAAPAPTTAGDRVLTQAATALDDEPPF